MEIENKRNFQSSKSLVSRLIIIYLLALTVRVGLSIAWPQALKFDEPYYNDHAIQIASGEGLSLPYSAWHTSIPNQPTSIQEPIYPLFLAAIKLLFGMDNHLAERLVQSMIGSFIPVIIAILGRQIFNQGIGLLAGTVLAVYPPLIYYNRLLITETLYTFFLVGTVCIASFQSQSKKKVPVITGVCFGLASLTRGALLAFTPILFLWSMFTGMSRKGITAAFLTVLGAIMVIAPWTLRNYTVHGTVVPITTKGGWNLYFYNFPIQNYKFNTDRWKMVPVPDLEGLSEVERDKEYSKRALGFIKENPRLFVSFAVIKLIDFWNPTLDGGRKIFSWINWLSYGIFAIFAFWGFFRSIARQKIHPVSLLIWLLIGFKMALAMLITGGGKARIPIEPFLVLLGCEIIWGFTILARQRFHIASRIV